LEYNQENIQAALAVHIASLIHKVQENEPLTDQEQRELDEWRQKAPHDGLFAQLSDRQSTISEVKEMNGYDSDTVMAVNTIFDHLGLVHPRQARRVLLLKRGLPAAAAVLLAVSGLWLFASRESRPKPGIYLSVYKNDIPPGGNKAMLTLADGSTIELDNAQKSALAGQGGAHLAQPEPGKLAYTAKDKASKKEKGEKAGEAGGKDTSDVPQNTLSTPAGGQYQVTLSDGTRVWLNALSSLKYPAAFTGQDREVELTGEAYFEVATDADHPFRVNAGSLQVQVLGTHFNVNAYSDESAVRTTLLEGSVRLSQGNGGEILLQPGQQAQTTVQGVALSGHADADKAVAWKNGYFSFEGADIHTVMRQIARWYGVQVRYEGTPTSATFGGDIERDLSLVQLLQGLGRTNLHFRLENKVLTVLP
jgi:transmembrane sensor